jgi:hypothetical protein
MQQTFKKRVHQQMRPHRRTGVTLSAPVDVSTIPLATLLMPFASGIDLQSQLQLSIQLVPPATTSMPQVTISAEVAQAFVDWISKNPGQALLWGAGAVLFIYWLDNASRTAPRRQQST